MRDRLLYEALEQTFPASDPIALQQVSLIGRESKAVPTGKHADNALAAWQRPVRM